MDKDLINRSEDKSINIEFIEELKILKDECEKNNLFLDKFKNINDYINKTYPEIQRDLESRFPKKYENNKFKNHIELLNKALEVILFNVDNDNYFKELDLFNIYICVNFIETMILYNEDKIDLDETNNKVFLISHEINPNKFKKLSYSGLLALCEMSENGLSVDEFSRYSNLKIMLLNDVANGKFKRNIDDAIQIEIITDVIDSCFNNDNSMEILEYENDFSLLFELDEDSNVCIFLNYDLINPYVIINSYGDFIYGDINKLLKIIHENSKVNGDTQSSSNIEDIFNRYKNISNITESDIKNILNLLNASSEKKE
jgi:hypothetical protein